MAWKKYDNVSVWVPKGSEELFFGPPRDQSAFTSYKMLLMDMSTGKFEELTNDKPMKKYYCFRDLDNQGNLEDGKTHHPAGVVEEIFNLEKTYAGKDLVIWYFDPFKLTTVRTWRTYAEVELFEITEDEHTDQFNALKQLEDVFQ